MGKAVESAATIRHAVRLLPQAAVSLWWCPRHWPNSSTVLLGAESYAHLLLPRSLPSFLRRWKRKKQGGYLQSGFLRGFWLSSPFFSVTLMGRVFRQQLSWKESVFVCLFLICPCEHVPAAVREQNTLLPSCTHFDSSPSLSGDFQWPSSVFACTLKSKLLVEQLLNLRIF